MKKITGMLIIFLCLIPLFLPRDAVAQTNRSYQYNRISAVITVNKDTSFDVAETQTYQFRGSYHEGYRDIPLNKIDAIDVIRVVDETMNTPLLYSSSRLEKENPSSWGKYTTYTQSGKQIIEWYYNATDESRRWTLYYKLYGGLEFLRDKDRLYWNLFTSYQVPVITVSVRVVLPDTIPIKTDWMMAYRGGQNKQITKTVSDLDKSVTFQASNIVPYEAFTVDMNWPKGFIDRSAYWRTFFKLHYGYIGAVIILLLSIITGFVYWLVMEYLPQKRLTVVPEYKPPKNLRPAIAEIVVKETLTPKGMAATIVDLAVRGYLEIEEISGGGLTIPTFFGFLFTIIILGMIFTGFITTISVGGSFAGIMKSILFFVSLCIVLVLFAKSGRGSVMEIPKNYKVSLTNKPQGEDIKEYERAYVEALMQGGDSFTTDELKQSTDRSLYQTIQEIKDDIYKQASADTKAFAVDLLAEKKKWVIWGILLFGVFFLTGYTAGLWTQAVVLAGSLLVGGAGLYAFIRFEARLNREGMILKDEWLGFKLYLETAEKGGMQHAESGLFPKYLPYAMIFGVEKKWANAFKHIVMPAQTWYAGSGGHFSGGSSFSSSGGSMPGFSASFSSSFSSAFASSAGGGGGGGGGAGGGGGGGGGGAS